MRNRSSREEILRFLLVGSSTVLVDLAIYIVLLTWLNPSTAKGISFICGTIYAYQANRLWTFSSGSGSLLQVVKFSAVYGFNLAVNVSLNAVVLSLLAQLTGRLGQLNTLIAFIIATGVSAVLNFLGMKFFVFKKA
ncbi:MAG: GtrA family protein [Phormidesmis priestleyi]|uniref:GtrA family protein n=1 Tax=Phormidesmis priestleyi TaxID=268141 RepID=A0A2W4XV33_9CYAN|nr:MAG: GtrA family protein [Phormidesmis priestleyi]